MKLSLESDASEWENCEKTLQKWERRARDSQSMHNKAAQYYNALHYSLSIPVIILTAVMGTAAFASVQQTVIATYWKVAFGILAMVAAAFAGVQAFGNFFQIAQTHHKVAARYGSIRREIDKHLSTDVTKRGLPSEIMEQLRQKLDDLAHDSPIVSPKHWRRAMDDLLKNNQIKESVTASYNRRYPEKHTRDSSLPSPSA